MAKPEIPIERLEADAYRVPTDRPESDGTIAWDHTDLVVVHARAGGRAGLGWSYAPAAASSLVRAILAPALNGCDAMDTGAAWSLMAGALRNAGSGGAGMMAVSAVDTALWDLKARILGVSASRLLGRARDSVEIYGSGGFTSYTEARLCSQLEGWAQSGIGLVKMKVGSRPGSDPGRVRAARRAVGPGVGLLVDANGAYSRKQAAALAHRFASEAAVSWFEEPVPSHDLEGLHLLRGLVPAPMEVAAGEYGDSLGYFLRMLRAGAVDCLQADATRCGGFTGFLKAAALCEAFSVPLSAHCAPQLHAHVGCAAAPLRHVEYFHDHARIAGMLFDGALEPRGGRLSPDPGRPGHGVSLRLRDAARFRI